MCELMEKFGNEVFAEGIDKGSSQMATDTALAMLRDNKPIEEIIKYSHLPESRIRELAEQIK